MFLKAVFDKHNIANMAPPGVSSMARFSEKCLQSRAIEKLCIWAADTIYFGKLSACRALKDSAKSMLNHHMGNG